MKLPFHNIIGPILKPNLGITRKFCQHPTFAISVLYTYFYATIGFFINANYLRKYLGKWPALDSTLTDKCCGDFQDNIMMLHDLRVIATSMGLIQYSCLLIGCFTENPALFLPHLAGQFIVVTVKVLNTLLLMNRWNLISLSKIKHTVPAILLMTFNWLQEFCVFRQQLCFCDI